MDQACINLRWAEALIGGLTSAGVRLLVLSPGSRSTPLVLAAQRDAAVELIPILDERSAAFFALGAARATGQPVGLIATSGSAAAHWYPAAVEASETGVPLVLLSADRPPTLRGFGANQTIDQTRLFGAFAREAHDPGLPRADAAGLKAIAALGRRCASIARGPRPGPVQINLPFDEPLVPARDCDDEALTGSLFAGDLPQGSTGVEATLPGEAASAPLQLPAGRGLILAGPGLFEADFASALRDAAHRLSLPVLADPLSGLRFGPAADAVLTGYDALLRNESAADALRPDWVLRFGGAPVSKVLGQWLAGIPAILVDPTGGWTDPSHDLIRRLVAEPAAACRVLTAPRTPETAWLERWRRAENRVKAIAEAQLAEPDWCEAKLIRALLKAIPSGESLLCANSLPIRQLDTWSAVRKAPLAIHGNRGASGIDGQLSTLAGLNEGDSPCWALLGDLSAVHDLSGWLLKDRLRRPVVVINNGGGRIFDYLPQRGLPGFETLWRTPVAPGFAALADAFGFSHREIRSADDLDEALRSAMKPHANSGSNAMLWEVVIDADRSRRVQLDYWRQVADAEGLVEP